MWSTISDYIKPANHVGKDYLIYSALISKVEACMAVITCHCSVYLMWIKMQSPRSSSPQLHCCHQSSSCVRAAAHHRLFLTDLTHVFCVHFTYAAQRLNRVFVLVGYASLASQWTEWKHLHLLSFQFNSWNHDDLFIFAVNSYDIRVKQDLLHVILDNFWQQHDHKHLGFGRLQKQWCTKHGRMPAIHMWISLQHT